MARWSKVSKGTLDDEKVRSLSPTEKLVFLSILIHPAMTPMGAGVLHPVLLGDALSLPQEQIEAALGTIAEQGMILRDAYLIILKNFLLPDYNLPDSPHQLVGWIETCETLPRSAQFAALRDHLKSVLNGAPAWLFTGLLNPLAEGNGRGLKRLFWERTGYRKPEGKRHQSREVSRHQSTDQEQEQYQKKKVCSTASNVPVQVSEQEEIGVQTNLNNADTSNKSDLPIPDQERACGAAGGGRTPDEMFSIFYDAYPRHEHRLRAREVFMSHALNVDWALLQKMLATIAAAKRTGEWQDPQFVPLPDTWLRNKGWLNDYTPIKKVRKLVQ